MVAEIRALTAPRPSRRPCACRPPISSSSNASTPTARPLARLPTSSSPGSRGRRILRHPRRGRVGRRRRYPPGRPRRGNRRAGQYLYAAQPPAPRPGGAVDQRRRRRAAPHESVYHRAERRLEQPGRHPASTSGWASAAIASTAKASPSAVSPTSRRVCLVLLVEPLLQGAK